MKADGILIIVIVINLNEYIIIVNWNVRPLYYHSGDLRRTGATQSAGPQTVDQGQRDNKQNQAQKEPGSV